MPLDANLISIALGLFVGLVLALTGAGGSILAIPLLAFGLHLSMAQAAPIGLLAVMLASSIGAIQGLRAGTVRYKAAMLIASFGVLFAPLGIWLAHRTSNQHLSLMFAIVLAYVAWRMWHQNTQNLQADTHKPAPACVLNPATSRLFWTAPCTKRLVITGSLAGFLSGLLGVGGGFVIVPSLRKVSNFDMQTIVATSLMAIAIVSAVSISTYLLHSNILWQIAIPFAASTMVSMLVFRLISTRIPAIISQRSFAMLATIAALMLAARGFLTF
ncbi:MAG: sulfite exporter TauE/SafE family protein [Methylotenera sp.]